MRFPSPAWLLSLMLLALTTTGCSLGKQEPPAVASLTITDQIDEVTKAPLSAATTFPKGVPVIYAAVEVHRPQQGTQLQARWFYDRSRTGRFLPADTAEVTFDKASRKRQVAFSLRPTTAFPAGTYKVEIFLDGQLAKEETFSVE